MQFLPSRHLLRWPLLAILLCPLGHLCTAQYPPDPVYDTIVQSPIDPNIQIAYNQLNDSICTTAFSRQKQYSGYISIPPNTLQQISQDYPINYFFWFVEARTDPENAPLTIFLNGGPGTSSMFGLFNEIGPCEVIMNSNGSLQTQARMWGWDRSSNILFIDQPNQVGFSYDTPTNGTIDFYTNIITQNATLVGDRPDFMLANGTFPSLNSGTVNSATTTEVAAMTSWHFLQTWLATFPSYNPAIRGSDDAAESADVGIHLFAESYGGKYGSVFASYFEEQNTLRENGQLPVATTLAIHIESVGIMNGIVDDLIQNYYWPQFAYSNTYGIEAINQVEQLNALNAFFRQDGCRDQILACRGAMDQSDTEGLGESTSTNAVCSTAQQTCNDLVGSYAESGRNVYDIRLENPSPDPSALYQEYLNNATVLKAIGAAVNFTESNPRIQQGFISTGDTIRGGILEDLAFLLRNNIRVALIYGDADFIVNWLGGEAVSLAVAALVSDYPATSDDARISVPYAQAFPDAGYAEIVVNNSYVGGAVRQYGNLSFSRIYDSGHFVPFSQPETAFTVFTRIINGDDISTGVTVDLSMYGSEGPSNSTRTNDNPSTTPSPTCWVRAWNQSCSDEDTKRMLQGSGVEMLGQYFQNPSALSSAIPSTTSRSSATRSQSSSSNASSSGTATGDSADLTGVYTATATPSEGIGSSMRVLPGLSLTPRIVAEPVAGILDVKSASTVVVAMCLGIVLMMQV